MTGLLQKNRKSSASFALKRANQTQRRINVDFPIWVIDSLDREASRIGVTRQSRIKLWLVNGSKKKAL